MLVTASIILTSIVLSLLWLRNIGRAVETVPPQAKKLYQQKWTRKDVDDAYKRAQVSPIDVRPYLLPKRSRRYVVVGGSGLVGGWIVHHLLMRGEDPRAIRIIDLATTKRQEALDADIDCVLADVSDSGAVNRAFKKDWPTAVRSWSLTVFHTAAYINASDRKPDYLSTYLKINVGGTQAVLNAAKAAGASCLVATSSGSVGINPPSFLGIPFPKGVYQFRPNGDNPRTLDAPLVDFGSCYAWSKAQAEKMVVNANEPEFRTGVIRPGHGIYGHGTASSSSLTWDYLRRGGTPTWIQNCVSHFVSAQNVSIGHLAYENAILEGKHKGGKPYLVTDPNPPILYGYLYDMLEQLADPSTPVKFTYIPTIVLLVLAYMVETYLLIRQRYAAFLPKLTGDIVYCQPAIFNMCALHLIFTDDAAQKEIGYQAPITTIDGFALAVADWNGNIETSRSSYIGKASTGAETLAT